MINEKQEAVQVPEESSASVKATGQKQLSVILDEIEATAKKWLGDLPYCDCEGCTTAQNALALVKALRRAVEIIEHKLADEPVLLVHRKCEITAILTEPDKAFGRIRGAP